MADPQTLIELRAQQTLGPRNRLEDPSRAAGVSTDDREHLAAEGAATNMGLTFLSEVNERTVEWLVPFWIPRGKLTLLEGDPGCGKTTLSIALVAAETTGGVFNSHRFERPRGAIYLSYEDSAADTLRPRLESAGGDASRVLVFDCSSATNGDASLPEFPKDVWRLEAECRGNDVGILVIDPLSAALSGVRDSHRDSDVRRALTPLASFAERTGVAVIAIRHLSKGGSARAILSGNGSIAGSAAARAVIRIDWHPGDPTIRLMSMVKNNLADAPATIAFQLIDAGNGAAAVRWVGPSELSADDLAAARDLPARPRRHSRAQEFVREKLKDGDREKGELVKEAAAADISKSALERASKALGVFSRVRGFGAEKFSVWSLPQE